jgi:hypothetical protein
MGFFFGAAVTVAFALLVLVGLRPVERFLERFRVRQGIAPDKQEPQPPESPKR